jgi:hypothetical protein
MSKRIQVTMNTSNPRLPGAIGQAFAAGLFDGEGCVHIAKQKHSGCTRGHVFRLVVSISQNHLNTLIDFQSLVGVEGRIYHQTRQGTTNRDWYTLNYDGKTAAALIEVLHPFLIRKASEVKVALEFQNDCHITTHFGPKGCPPEIWQRREALYRKLRNLK